MTSFEVFIATEVRIYKVDGHFYADPSFAKILERYSKNFDKIILATRIVDEKEKREGYKKIDDFCCIFDNIGSISAFLFKKTSPDIIKHIKESDLIVLRLQSVISLKMYYYISKFSKKYMVEVMGCAWDAYWNHGIIGKTIAPFMFLETKRIIKKANYCVYVTQKFLQRRYPCDGKNIGISNVDIKTVMPPKQYKDFDKKKFTMMTAAALHVKYKGQQFVIKAISELKQKYDINVTYYLAGKGDDVWLRNVARKYNVERNVVFLGMLPKEKLHKYMRDVDFYIQPSLQEGLPRSLIEAMSCGSICFGSNTAGIPELLDDAQIFERKDVKSMIEIILSTIKSGNFFHISERNIQKAKLYLSSVLDKKRSLFLKSMRGAK